MFPTQRTVRGAALAMSAALGLGGAVAPATLAPATFASVARAQNHTPISSPNLPGVLTEHADERRLRLEVLAQSGDYTRGCLIPARPAGPPGGALRGGVPRRNYAPVTGTVDGFHE